MPVRWLSFGRRFPGRARRGSVVALTALLIVPITVAMGMALDGARIYLVRSRLGEAVDAAALASAQGVGVEEMESLARRLLEANYPHAYMRSALGAVEVRALDSGRVEIVGRAALPMVVMSLVGAGSVTVEARAVAQREVRGLELALVLDSTGSMKGDKLAALKSAVHDLLGILFGEDESSGALRIAVVPFSARVNIGKSNAAWLSGSVAPSGWKGCVETRGGLPALSDAPPSEAAFAPTTAVTVVGWHKEDGEKVWGPYTVTPPCPRPILPLSGSRSAVADAVDALGAKGTTRIDMGARWGWRTLSERWTGLWGEPGSPLPDDDRAAKAVVIMTDGENVSDAYDEVTPAQADANLLLLCERMRLEDYLVFTITFQAPASVEPMMRACAADPTRHFASPTPDALRAAFRQIGNRLSALRLVE